MREMANAIGSLDVDDEKPALPDEISPGLQGQALCVSETTFREKTAHRRAISAQTIR
jgi:hypothetical protein